jgi:hypothetical protein
VIDDFSYSFYKAVYNVYRISQSLGYEFSYYFIGDTYVNDEEIKKIKDIKNEIDINRKMGYFERVLPSSGNEIVPFFWMVDIKWFINNAFQNLENKNDFLKNMTGLCVYEHQLMKKIEENSNDIIIKDLKDQITSFVGNERFDLSKKKDLNSFYSHDIGIFFYDDVPNIVAFNFKKTLKSWRIIVEENNKITKYDLNVFDQWFMIPISIESNEFRIKCEDNIDRKVIYDIYINDINRYKNIFKINCI